MNTTRMSHEVSKWLGSVGYNPNIHHLYVGEIAHLLTIDPNFQRDIQVSPSSLLSSSSILRIASMDLDWEFNLGTLGIV